MPIIYPFYPSNVAAPRFTPTLDNATYSVIVTWNVSAQRYFINVYASDGTWVVTTALVESLDAVKIDAMTYDPTQRVMQTTLAVQHNRPVCQIVKFWLTGMQPDWLNGEHDCMVTDFWSFSFPVDTDPGQVVVLGTASRLINLVASYFDTSALAFRNQAFEVWP